MRFAKAVWAWLKKQFTPSKEAWSAATWALIGFTLLLIIVNALYSIATNFTVERFLGFSVVLALSLAIALGIMFVAWLTSAFSAISFCVIILNLTKSFLADNTNY